MCTQSNSAKAFTSCASRPSRVHHRSYFVAKKAQHVQKRPDIFGDVPSKHQSINLSSILRSKPKYVVYLSCWHPHGVICWAIGQATRDLSEGFIKVSTISNP